MAEDRSSNDNKVFLTGMIFSMFCWGISWTSGKILSTYGDALNISFYRFSFTFISLFFILLLMKEKFVIAKKGWADLFCAALLIAIYTFLFFKGLMTGMPGAAGVLVTTLNPIISYAIMLTLTRRLPTPNEAIGLFLGLLAGAVLLKIWEHPENLLKSGNTYFLMASFTWAILSLFTAKGARHGSPVTFSFWMYGISSLLMLIVTSHEDNLAILNKSDFSFWGNLFFSATITTALATTFYFVATSKIGASKASSFIFLVPASAALGSWIFLKEIPQLHTHIGGGLGMVAVYIINRKTRENKKAITT